MFKKLPGPPGSWTKQDRFTEGDKGTSKWYSGLVPECHLVPEFHSVGGGPQLGTGDSCTEVQLDDGMGPAGDVPSDTRVVSGG